MKNKTMKLAEPGQRFLAALLDSIIPTIITISVGIIVGVIEAQYYMNYGLYYDMPYGLDNGYYQAVSIPTEVVVAAIFCFVALIAYLGVQIFFWIKGQSIGKRLLGLLVVRSDNGEPLSSGYMLLRELIVKEASAVFLLGFIWIFIDSKNRSWHDKILDTYVVDLKGSEMIGQKEVVSSDEPPVATTNSDTENTTVDEVIPEVK